MDINQDLTKEQQDKRDRFYRVLDRIQLSHENALPPEDNDLLKATFTPEQNYSITFIHKEDKRTYQAIYKGGDLERLVPENENLVEDLQTSLGLDKTIILDVSNSIIELEQSINQQLSQPNVNKSEGLVQELSKVIPSQNSIVNNQNKLNDFNKRIDESIRDQKELVQTFEEYLDRTEAVKEHPEVRDQYKQDLLLKMDQINDQYEKSVEHLNELEKLKSLTNVLSNINYQSVREQGKLSELYSENQRTAGMLIALDPKIPFQRGFEQRIEEVFSKQGSSFALGLAMDHQVADPKEQVKLHLLNYNNIQEFVNQPYQPLDQKMVERLREYSYESMEKAVNIVNEELSKNHTQDIRINRTVVVAPEAKEEKQRAYDQLYENLRPVAMLQDKEINLMNIHEISSGYGSRVSNHWHKEIINSVENYVMSHTDYRSKEGYIPLDEVDKSIQILSVNGVKRTELQSQELNKSLSVINDMSVALDRRVKHLESQEPNRTIEKEINEVKEMKKFMENYHEHVVENVLTQKEKSEIVQSVVLEAEQLTENQSKDIQDHQDTVRNTESANNKSSSADLDYYDLVKRIAELEKMANKKEQRNILGSVSESVKNGIKNELEKLNNAVEKIGKQVQELKENLKQFTYGKVESAYKIANKAVNSLEKKVHGMKESIQKELEDVQEKMNEKSQEKNSEEMKGQESQKPKEVEIER
ncbi:hypothetical protein G3M81_23030 [Bacillus paralicheniformis]|nr:MULTISPECIES: hypothetical protein [Bacillus]QII26966.1 hypothetical protein G3M80_20940 [Bacillus altitudinis]QII51434.1 hypothetical protein G3M81_23030 [Bacillus paralicheniformis]